MAIPKDALVISPPALLKPSATATRTPIAVRIRLPPSSQTSGSIEAYSSITFDMTYNTPAKSNKPTAAFVMPLELIFSRLFNTAVNAPRTAISSTTAPTALHILPTSRPARTSTAFARIMIATAMPIIPRRSLPILEPFSPSASSSLTNASPRSPRMTASAAIAPTDRHKAAASSCARSQILAARTPIAIAIFKTILTLISFCITPSVSFTLPSVSDTALPIEAKESIKPPADLKSFEALTTKVVTTPKLIRDKTSFLLKSPNAVIKVSPNSRTESLRFRTKGPMIFQTSSNSFVRLVHTLPRPRSS